VNPIGSLLRAAVRKPDEKLNVLTYSTHEAYETDLCRTGHEFYSFHSFGHVKPWNTKYRPIPKNYNLIYGETQPEHIDYDLILSQNRGAHFEHANRVAKQLHIPHVELTHVLPPTHMNEANLEQNAKIKADHTVFITDFNRNVWKWKPDEATVILHGLDTDEFSPDYNIPLLPHVLTVANDYVNRDWCLGFSIWKEATQGLLVRPVGDTPGLSKAAGSVRELIHEYRSAGVFLNTSTWSPIPHSLLEAASCACPIVSTATCAIPEHFTHGVDCFLSNNPSELRKYIQALLTDTHLARRMGENARTLIINKFGLERFVSAWNETLQRVVDRGMIWA
jgi:glycosyltransferase involved in cell wall biosynthesis